MNPYWLVAAFYGGVLFTYAVVGLCGTATPVTDWCEDNEEHSHHGAYAPPARRLAGDPDQFRAPRPHRWGARPRARVAGPRARRAR